MGLITPDALGRITFSTTANTPDMPTVTLTRRYDAAGNLRAVEDNFNGLMTHAVDTNNRRTVTTHTESDPQGDAVAPKRAEFGYFANGLIETVDRFNVATGGDAFATTIYTYFDDNTVETIDHKDGSGLTIADYGYAYGPDGDMTQMTTPDGTIDFALDATGQVTGADYSGSQTDESYTYDDNGNRITGNGQTYGTAGQNRMTTDGTYHYAYDDNGNRTRRYVDVDDSDTLNAGDTDITEYEWDHRNRLIVVTRRDTHGGDATQTVAFLYDAFNNRISKIVDADGAGSAVRTNFALLDGEVYLEFNGSTLTHRYMPGTSIDMNLAIEETATNEVLWSLPDHQGTVRDVIDENAAVKNHIQYTSFGGITSESDDTVDYRFTYTGREFDAETTLYYYRARYYDAATGKFISEDPIAFEAGDANLYRYVSNRPMMHTDPSGLGRLVGPRSYSARHQTLLEIWTDLVHYHGNVDYSGSRGYQKFVRDVMFAHSETGFKEGIPKQGVPFTGIVNWEPARKKTLTNRRHSGSLCCCGS